jgi:hypothetical protein
VGSDGDRSVVRRDEGEVTSWPRGLAGYVPAGSPDQGPPSEEEDRLAQRIRLAARLIDLLRSSGREDPSWERELRAAERAYRERDRARAREVIERLIGVLGMAAGVPGASGPPPR